MVLTVIRGLLRLGLGLSLLWLGLLRLGLLRSFR